MVLAHIYSAVCVNRVHVLYNVIIQSVNCLVCILFLSPCFIPVVCSPQSVFYTDHVNRHRQTAISMRDGMPLLPKPGQLFCLRTQTLNHQGFIYRALMKWRTCRYTTCSQTTAFCSYEKSYSFCQLDMSTRFLNAINTDFNPLTPVPPVTGHDEPWPFFHF